MSWRIADLNCTACDCRLKDEMFKAAAMPNCPECGGRDGRRDGLPRTRRLR